MEEYSYTDFLKEISDYDANAYITFLIHIIMKWLFKQHLK